MEYQVRALDHRIADNQALAQMAIDKAAAQMEDRLAGMNEFRDTLKDQAGRFVTRTELDTLIKAQTADIRALRESRAHLEGVAKANTVYVGYALSIAALIAAVVGVFLR